ncbi:MAG TPA: arylsulfatase [Candidatus Hydrogenedentes bacterium]|nr:arylsulfatase [Candidatus Hydrogenedentota bacterium]
MVAPALAAAPTIRAATQGASMKPNILFIMGDQHRGDCIGADGHPVVRTPNMDRIGNEGIRFSRAYTAVPSCTPARSGLLTGLTPWHHGMLGYGRVGEKYPIEKPRVLRDAGYYTLGIGKMHWCPQRISHGFHKTILDESSREETIDFRSDYRAWFETEAPGLVYNATGIGWNDYRAKPYVLPEHLHPTRWTGDVATRFIESDQEDAPFFLKVSFARPHSPYDPPQRFWDLYEDAPIPPAVVGDWANKRYAPLGGNPDSPWHGDFGPEAVRRARQGYYGNVTFIDEQIGRILEVLEKRNLLDETLIVYTADHGDMTGDHHMWRKTYAYEASARIPMLMRWPEGLVSAARGQVCTLPVELRDILPTFMDASAAPGAEKLDGDSMLKLARGETDSWRNYIDFEHDTCYAPSNHWNGLTDGQWKYIYHAQDGQEQLFNLDDDPSELHDLAGDAAYTKTLQQWRGRLVAHFEERGEPFLKNGQLVPRPERMLYSPNYPGTPAFDAMKG